MFSIDKLLKGAQRHSEIESELEHLVSSFLLGSGKITENV
jgi:hypothetical protein